MILRQGHLLRINLQLRAVIFVSYQHRLMTGNSAWADLVCNGSLYLWNQNYLSTLKNPYRILFSSHNRAEMIHIHVHTFPSTSRTHISSG